MRVRQLLWEMKSRFHIKMIKKKLQEMLQPNPFASRYTQNSFIVLERNLYAIERQIVENKEIDDGRQDKQI